LKLDRNAIAQVASFQQSLTRQWSQVFTKHAPAFTKR
jgi:hypothetical protein